VHGPFCSPARLCPGRSPLRAFKKKKEKQKKTERKKKEKNPNMDREMIGSAPHTTNCLGLACAFFPSPLVFPFFFLFVFSALVISNVVTCLALFFNSVLLFVCANPSSECSLPRTPQNSTMS
jgi:hypothetical protein